MDRRVPLREAPDRDRAAAQLLLFHFGAAAAGLVHADPDPDDVRVQPDGRLAILDFGCWAEVPSERVALAREMLDALHARDPGAFAGALQRLGALPVSAAEATAQRADRFLALIADRLLHDFARPGAVRLDSDAVGALRDRVLALDGPDAELLLGGGLPAQDLWPARGAAQLFSAIARVGASGAWLELTRAALRDGWNATLA